MRENPATLFDISSMAIVTDKVNITLGGKSINVGLRFFAKDSKDILLRYARNNAGKASKPMTMKVLTGLYVDSLTLMPITASSTIGKWLAEQAVKNGFVKPIPKIWVTDIQEYEISKELMK